MEKEIKIGFASFDLDLTGGVDLHITIGRRYDATDAELAEMQQYVETQIRPQLPFTIMFGNFCHMGANGAFPAYRVYFIDPMGIISGFYQKFYKEAPGKALYPRPKFHITVDTPEKTELVENMIRTNRFMKLTKVSFRERIETARHNAERTISLADYLARSDRASTRTQQVDPIYEIPPPLSSTPSAPSAVAVSRIQVFSNGDWWCPTCKFKIFASKSRCGKCGTQRNN